MRVALLTGGGDCPGLNAVIYAAVRKGINHYGDEFIGFLNGWKGVLDNNFIPLTLDAIDGIQLKGGTILHSSRTNVKKIPGGIEKVQEVLKLNKIDALIALGGDDTQSVTLFLSENGVPSVGVPKTIDNDISGTDQTFGFDTAVMIATEAVDRIHTVGNWERSSSQADDAELVEIGTRSRRRLVEGPNEIKKASRVWRECARPGWTRRFIRSLG
jgi:6-phosphofructokinase 1